jgi:hypothetical protein
MKPYHDYVDSCLPACGPQDHQHTAQVSEQTFGEEMLCFRLQGMQGHGVVQECMVFMVVPTLLLVLPGPLTAGRAGRLPFPT